MDRFYWITANEHFLGENIIAQQTDVRLYNGDDRVGSITRLLFKCTYCIDNV